MLNNTELDCVSKDGIMKKVIFILLAASVALLCQTASADSPWGRGYDRHYGYGYGSHNYYGGSRYGRWNNYYNYGRRGTYIGFSLGGGHHYDSFSSSSFIGGLVLGSVLTYPRYSNTHNNYYRNSPSRVTVIKRTSPATVTSGRRLLRDLEGRCFEILRDENGDEIRTELEPEVCSF